MIYALTTKELFPTNEAQEGYVKIGYTEKQLSERISGIQLGCPFKLNILALRGGMRLEEKEIHKDLKEYRVRGEWFVDCKEVRKRLGCTTDYPYNEMDKDKIFENQWRIMDRFMHLNAVSCYDLEFLCKYLDLNINRFEKVKNHAFRSMKIKEDSKPLTNYVGPDFKGKRKIVFGRISNTNHAEFYNTLHLFKPEYQTFNRA